MAQIPQQPAASPAPTSALTPFVRVQIPQQPPKDIPLDHHCITIGRALENDIVLSPTMISKSHARIEWTDGAWQYIDTSSNGSYHNGTRLPRDRHIKLQPGDTLLLGASGNEAVVITYTDPASTPAQPGAGQPTISLKPPQPGQGKTSLVIGRNPQSDIPLTSPNVSWKHARLDIGPQTTLVDLESSNGTFVNGQRIHRTHTLKQGDRIQIGPFRLAYDGSTIQPLPATQGVRLQGINLVKVGRKQKRILHDVSLSIEPCEFVALVGPSGAGKSTLMRSLSGFDRAEGTVMVDGDNLYEQFDLYRADIGYVPQDDIIHRNLTVRQALRYAARLRLPPDTAKHEIEDHVNRALQQVEMQGHDSKLIYQLSGGQRKRVSIAVELLARPKLFFLDEPTSGLDPGLEQTMMKTLRKLAKEEAQTIILVTHATANISECDHVCFMAQGHLVYFGPPDEALSFFGLPPNDMNGFAKIYTMIDDPDPKEAVKKAQDWEKRYQASPQYQQYMDSRKTPAGGIRHVQAQRQLPRVDVWMQFRVLTQRYMDLVFRDKMLLFILLAVMPIIGLLLLIVSEPSWLTGDTAAVIEEKLTEQLADGDPFAFYEIVGKGQQLLFMMALATVLLGVFAAASEIVKEQAIYRRERMVGLRILPYLSSKVMVLFGFALLQSFLLLLVLGLRIQLPEQGIFWPTFAEMYITLVFGALAAILMGLCISALVPNSDVVAYVVLVVLFSQISFAGILFQDIPSMTTTPILSRWVVEGLGSSVNMEALDETGLIRLQPDPITEEVEFEVEKPDDNWEPFTMTTELQTFEGCAGPIPVPMCTPNEPITVTETLTKEVTVEPDVIEKAWPHKFPILSYDSSFQHLVMIWLIELAFALVAGIVTVVILLRKDL
ncbi:MAG: FHA domain-containing protein [Chloroflexaceae bacterium]|nr:FHA domain-containing protein [Chloroflexaceae bacterium]